MAIGAQARTDRRLAERIAAAPVSAAARLQAAFLADRERWALWFPVLLGGGVAGYFALPVEPPAWLAVLAFAVAAAAAALLRRSPGLLPALALATVALGVAAAQWRAAQVAAPILRERLGPVEVEGRVVLSTARPDGVRLTLEQPVVARLAPEATPERLRITVRGAGEPVAVGARVRLLAVLNPPPEPAAPGAYDFARQAWFERLGAVGYALRRPQAVAASDDGEAAGWRIRIEAVRQEITDRVRAALPGGVGAVAAALMTGDRGAIPEDLVEAWRDSGLAHLLSISGLHIGLVWTLLFFACRAALALVEPAALRRPIKKWAAAAALLGAFGYLLISGAEVPTRRAFLMTSLVTLAILVDRSALSMRLVAWAAGAILLLTPEALLSASFQMSFGAVVALIAAYERLGSRFARWRVDAGFPRQVALYLVGVCATTFVAGLATAPFGVYHFNKLVNYSLAGNLLAVPVTSLWVMPCALLAFALMPFGLEGLALAPMGWGVELINQIAREVAGWPGAVTLVAAFPPATLALSALGGLWLCLWRGRWRWWGAAAVGLGFAIGPQTAPDLLIDADGKLFAMRRADGAMLLSARGRLGFDAETWARRAGIVAPIRSDPALRCDLLGCIGRAEGRTVAFIRDHRALAEDCAVADILLTAERVPRRCGAPLVVDRFDLKRGGAHALWFTASGVRMESVAARRGRRPWTQPPPESRWRPG